MEATSGVAVQDQYLTLLVSQLQNQDPLDPVSQEDFIGQVTQFSTLAEIEKLTGSFKQMLQLQADLLQLQEVALGSNLVGRTVSYQDLSGNSGIQAGEVDGFEVADGRVHLRIADARIPVAQVISLS